MQVVQSTSHLHPVLQVPPAATPRMQASSRMFQATCRSASRLAGIICPCEPVPCGRALRSQSREALPLIVVTEIPVLAGAELNLAWSSGRMIWRSFARARLSCTFTVPLGTPKMRAASRMVRPSKSCS